MLYSFIVALIVIICILLTIVVLLQPGQGEGLSGGLAGGMGGMGGGSLGARRTADILSKSTSVLGGALLVLCILANFAIDRGEATRSAVQEQGVQTPAQQDIDFANPSETPSAVPQQQGGSDNGSDNSDSDNGESQDN